MSDLQEELRNLEVSGLQTWLSKLAELESREPQAAKKLYLNAIARFPDQPLLLLTYGWFSSGQGDFEEALKVAAYIEKKALEPWNHQILKVFSSMKLQRYEDAETAFVKSLAHYPVGDSSDSNLMYFLFLIAKHQNYDYEKIEGRIEGLLEEHPELAEMEVFSVLKRLLKTQIQQIYGKNRHVSGFIMFIDLVNSTGYKQEYPEHWKERIVHFLLYTRFAFRYVGYDFIKFIGDEVMLFVPFGGNTKPSLIAKRTYDFLFGKSTWYPIEANRFNPSLDFEAAPKDSPHEIRVKIYIGQVTDALLFSPNSDSYYDLVGEDVDRAARLKEMATENLVVIDTGFKEALHENGPPYSEAFSSLSWKFKFKGFSEILSFFGQALGDQDDKEIKPSAKPLNH